MDINDELYHYGVLGMKWGVRKEYEPHPREKSNNAYSYQRSGVSRNKTSNSGGSRQQVKEQQKKNSNLRKVAIGAAAATGVLAAIGAAKLSKGKAAKLGVKALIRMSTDKENVMSTAKKAAKNTAKRAATKKRMNAAYNKAINNFAKNKERQLTKEAVKKSVEKTVDKASEKAKELPSEVSNKMAAKEAAKEAAEKAAKEKAAKEAAEKLAKNVDPKTGFHLKEKPTSFSHKSVRSDLYAINPDYNILDPKSTMNCVHCSITFSLRRMGYDVKATGNEAGLRASQIGRYFNGLKSESFVEGMDYDLGDALKNIPDPEVKLQELQKRVTDEQITNTSLIQKEWERFLKDRGKIVQDTISKRMVEQYPDGSTGLIMLNNFSGGGHAVAWYKSNGKIQFLDGQNPEFDLSMNYFGAYRVKRFGKKTKTDSVDTTIVRLDDLEVNPDTIGEVCQNTDETFRLGQAKVYIDEGSNWTKSILDVDTTKQLDDYFAEAEKYFLLKEKIRKRSI